MTSSGRSNFSVSALRLLCFLSMCVFTGVALVISFQSISVAFATWLFGARSRAFSRSQFSICLPHEARSFLAFDLRDVQLLLSLDLLEPIIGLLIGLISMWLCLREAQGEREKWENDRSVEQSEDTHFSQPITIGTSKMTDPRSL